MLDILGLDEVTYAVYRRWLLDPDSTQEDIGEELGHPPTMIRRATDRLVGLSLLIPSRDRPGHLLAVPPDGVFEQLLAQQHEQLLRRQEQLLRRHEQIARARVQVSALVADYARERQADGADVDRIHGADAVRAHMVGLVTRAEHEIVTLRTEVLVAPEIVKEILPAEVRALQRGVTMRGVYPSSVRTDDGIAGYARELAGHGLDLRISDDQPQTGVTAVDEWICLVLVNPGSSDDGALLLRTPALTHLAVSLFEQVWEQASPLTSLEGDLPEVGIGPAERADGDPSDPERALLQLLSHGAKDEAAARQLGVSVRTVRRMIADLMRKLDARSRFQAGVIASQRGWL